MPLYDMTVKLAGDTDRKMSEVIARKPVVFHCFIRRIRPEVVPEGAEADWLRDLYQEKDKRFQILKETDTLDNYVPSFPAAGTIAKEQKLPKPVLSKCELTSSQKTKFRTALGLLKAPPTRMARSQKCRILIGGAF